MPTPRKHPTLAQQVRARLADAKAAGLPFDDAWRQAQFKLRIRGQECTAWRAALNDPDVMRQFRAAYRDEWTPLAPLAGLTLEEVMAAGRDGLELDLAA